MSPLLFEMVSAGISSAMHRPAIWRNVAVKYGSLWPRQRLGTCIYVLRIWSRYWNACGAEYENNVAKCMKHQAPEAARSLRSARALTALLWPEGYNNNPSSSAYGIKYVNNLNNRRAGRLRRNASWNGDIKSTPKPRNQPEYQRLKCGALGK